MQCRECGTDLVEGENWYPSQAKLNYRICKNCQGAYVRQWRQEHKEEYRRSYQEYYQEHRAEKLKYQHRWIQAHSDHIREYKRQRCRDNTDHLRAYNHKYQKAHRAERRGYTQTRNALKANLPATLTAEQWRATLKEYDFRCAYCGRDDLPLQQEHKIPVSRGGGYTKENIVPACQPCNRRKGTKTFEEFLELLAGE